MEIENYHLIIWIILMWMASRAFMVYRRERVMGRIEWRCKPFFAVLVFLPIFIMTVYGRPRSDTAAYLSTFHNLPNTISEGWNSAIHSDRPGFILFGVLIKMIFGENETSYRFLIALVHSLPIVIILRKYSEDYLFSAYLFIATTIHLAWMMNGLRQFMAVTIIFAATPWIIQKKYVRSILIILLAATFHKTALVMLPVIFIVQGKVWNRKTIFYSIMIAGMTYIFAQNSGTFDTVASIAGYNLNAVREWGDDGANPLRVLVNAVPMLIAYCYRNRLNTEKDAAIDICINMSVITTGIYLVAMVTSGILTGRMPIYTSLYNLILLPYLINHAFPRAQKRMIYTAAVVLYFVYFLRSVA